MTGSAGTVRISILLLVLFCSSLAAESLTLKDLMDKTGARFQWDPWERIGLFIKDGKTLAFSPDNTWMIGDYSKRIETGAVLKDKGVLVFSDEAAQTVLKYFGKKAEETKNFNVKVILIDPGHGGKDPGTAATVNSDGIPVLVEEKNIVLDVSLRLADMLKAKYPDKKIVLTRKDDSYPTLEDRVALANSIELGPKEGIIFVAVHANASLNKKAEGYEVWHLPDQYRRDVLDDGEIPLDETLSPVVNTILEQQYSMDSVRLAQNILDSFGTELPGVINRGLKEESWYVVRNAKMAAVLVELGYVTNKEEVQRMMTTSYLKKLTVGLYNGINRFVDYFEEKGFSR